MAEHIIDAFITKFILDRSDFKDGVEEVEQGSKRLKETQRKTFDEIEQAGKKTGESIKAVSREVIGLGLAFMGAKSIVGFIKDMSTGAASADRFGQTLQMSVKQVWAWRQAMKSVGGQAGEGDAALQRIQQIRMGLATGNVDAGSLAALGRLGVSLGDLQKGNAGSVLSKLAGASGKMNPQLYASLLQQIGLPQSTIYFLQQGQAKVDEMLKQFAANADQQEAMAKKTEELQASMASLDATVSEMLVPVLKDEILPALKTIADWLNVAVGGVEKPKTAGDWAKRVAGDAITGKHNAWEDLYEYLGPEKGSWIPESWRKGGAKGGTSPGAPTLAPRGQKAVALQGNNPGGIVDGDFARSQPGYVGGNGRYAAFATMAHGIAAQAALLASYVRRGFDTPIKIAERWAPRRDGNNPVAYATNIARQLGIGINDRIGPAQLAAFQHAQAVAENHHYGRGGFARMSRNAMTIPRSVGGNVVNIGQIAIHTQAKNAAEIARNLPSELRRRGVIMQADRVLTP
jgi:hypothetical protein